MSQNLFKLYSYCNSSASWRVRTVLNLKGLKYEYITINLLKAEQKSPEYEKINPHKVVPTFFDGNKKLIESTAIIEYLEELYPNPALYPSDPFQKAKVRAFSEIINSAMQPAQNLSQLQRLENDYKIDKVEWVTPYLNKGFQALETLIKEEGAQGRFSFGDKITLADVYLLPQVIGNVRRFGFDITPFENVARVTENLKQEQAFIDALPVNCPDAPKQ